MRGPMVIVLARTNLLRLFRSRDYWIPLVVLAGLFFVAVPVVMLALVGRTAPGWRRVAECH